MPDDLQLFLIRSSFVARSTTGYSEIKILGDHSTLSEFLLLLLFLVVTFGGTVTLGLNLLEDARTVDDAITAGNGER